MQQHAYTHLLIEEAAPHVALVTLNRPEVYNAFNTQMGQDLLDVFTALSDDPEVRAVVVKGAGEKAFCTGADLKERASLNDAAWLVQHRLFERAMRAVLECRHPVIAAVDGFALGGGLELALNCDMILATEVSTFSQPEVMRGIIPGGGGTQLLPRRIGSARAKELIFSGRRIDAVTAEGWGLLNRIAARGKVLEEAIELAVSMAANGPIAVRQAKWAIARGMDQSIIHGLVTEIDAYNVTVPTEDRYEGVRAFNEKRAPDFKGR